MFLIKKIAKSHRLDILCQNAFILFFDWYRNPWRKEEKKESLWKVRKIHFWFKVTDEVES